MSTPIIELRAGLEQRHADARGSRLWHPTSGERVIGRALHCDSYALNEECLFNAEHADILGIDDHARLLGRVAAHGCFPVESSRPAARFDQHRECLRRPWQQCHEGELSTSPLI